MTALVELSWDVAAVDGGARRPSLADVGSALLEDKAGSPPPKTGTHPYADLFNQGQKQLAAIGRMLPGVKLTILAAGAARAVQNIQAAGLNVVIADFPLVRDSAGVTRIQWTSTKIPNPTCWPEVTPHGASGLVHGASAVLDLNTSGAGAGAVTPGTHRIIVTTHTAGVVADISFTVSIN